ncbi:hypothetical protein KVR01_008581 [Diaporthe batatas]|uniref:uncharacterized protein n=1 Tax=Diaporthe batatas TaxID=748121 RepID=UPI001D03A4FD|nr:uncharacterized protein KVR01_008581 [Diaporthe batatas]KAG8161594.1 hypothetical protein KVR01_008581 [Diaporthe batatas]
MSLELDPARWIVTFGRPMAAAALSAAAACLYNKLKAKFTKVEISIEGTDGTQVRVVYEAGNGNGSGGFAFLGTSVGSASGPVATIDEALREMLTSGKVPAGETWDISADTKPSPLALTTSSSNSLLPASTTVAGYTSQTGEAISSNMASSGLQQQQQQPDRETIVPTIVSLSKSTNESPGATEQPAEYISQPAEPSTNDAASYGFHQQQDLSSSETCIPTHFNDDNPNGVQRIAV